MAASTNAMVYSREFHSEGEAFALPASSVTSFQDLLAILFKIHKQDPTTHDVHVHLNDIACNGIISDITWDAGVYLAPTQDRLDIFPHFVGKGAAYSTYARPIGETPVRAVNIFQTPVRNGINKGLGLHASVPKRALAPLSGITQRLTSSVPRARSSLRSEESPLRANGDATRSLGEDDTSLFIGNGEGEGNPVTEDEGAEPATPNGIANPIAHTPGPLFKLEAADLDPALMVNVTYTYYQGTAGVFRNFRVHSLALPLATDVHEIRGEIANAITHSINSSSRLRIYRSQVEYDIFISANAPGAQNHGLHEATTLGAHMIAIGAAGGLLINTYIYLSHDNVRYGCIEDAIPDAEHARAATKAATAAAKAARAARLAKAKGLEPTKEEPVDDEAGGDAATEAADDDNVAVNSDSESSSFAPRSSARKSRRVSARKNKALKPRSPSSSPAPAPRSSAKRRKISRRVSPDPDDDMIRENGIVVGQTIRSNHEDGRRNAVIATMSPAGRMLFQAIDEDLVGGSMSVRGNARQMPEDVEYLREYRKMGREQRRTMIKRKIEEAFGPI